MSIIFTAFVLFVAVMYAATMIAAIRADWRERSAAPHRLI